MTGNSSDDADGTDESLDSNAALETTVTSSTYKVLGEFSDASGAGVLGRNNASSGTPIGVEGAVPNTTGYGLYTDDDAFVGSALRFGDASGDGNAFSVAERSDGNLEVAHGGTPTHEFASNGDTNIAGSFTENASL